MSCSGRLTRDLSEIFFHYFLIQRVLIVHPLCAILDTGGTEESKTESHPRDAQMPTLYVCVGFGLEFSTIVLCVPICRDV